VLYGFACFAMQEAEQMLAGVGEMGADTHGLLLAYTV
jgi:hypothetical protein